MTHQNGIGKKVELTSTIYLSSGSHILYTYTDMNKYLENAASYIAEGLAKDQTVIFIDQPERFDMVIERLKNAGYSEEKRKAIIFADLEKCFGTHGDFTIDQISQRLHQLFTPYLGKDRTIRLWGRMTWTDEPDRETLRSRITLHEKCYDMFASGQSNVISVCAYDGLKLPSSFLIELLETHEYHMTDMNLSPSHLYKRKPVLFPAVSEQLKLEKAVQNQAVRSEKLSAAGELAASIAHELRNPLTVARGYLQLIDKTGDISEKSEKYLHTIGSEIEKIELIASEFLALAKPHAENKKENNILQLVENVKTLMEPQAAYKTIDLHIEADHDGMAIMCDEMKIKQVFVNLIKNAIEAMEKGYITLSIKDAGNDVHIYVTDNGPGIPDDILNKLGQPFITSKETGTGLGLLVSKKIIKEHNGKLHVESDVGTGTTFTISLPKS